jgi:hypothetical protein
VLFMPSTVEFIEDLETEPIGHELEALSHYMYGYGCISRLFVSVVDWSHFACRPWCHTEYSSCLSCSCWLIGWARSHCGFRCANICQSRLQGYKQHWCSHRF